MTETMTIEVGNRVRSFDFEDRHETGERACYVEGEVVEIGNFPEFPDCPRYKIRVDRHVFGGEELAEHEDFVFPPVNGTPRLFGGEGSVTNGVELIDN